MPRTANFARLIVRGATDRLIFQRAITEDSDIKFSSS
jgi:hypothetical protein